MSEKEKPITPEPGSVQRFDVPTAEIEIKIKESEDGKCDTE